MKITLVAIGSTRTDYIRQGIKTYLDRLKHYISFESIEIADPKSSKSMTPDSIKAAEAVAILNTLQRGDKVILLDERGKEYTSREFSNIIQREMLSGIKRLVFVVGGPYGFAQTVYQRADTLISFSKMTFSHEMIRLFFVEQIYRVMTILNNEPYHHD